MNGDLRGRGFQFRVGLLLLVAIVAFVGMIYALGARARLFESRYTIHAEFSRVGGLVEGATVRLAGVQIGRVSGVHLPAEPGGKVQVDLTIATRYADRIRKDSVAEIETQGLLGDRIVEVSVGTGAASVVKPGETILSREPFDIGQALGEGATTMRSVAELAESLRRTADALNDSKVLGDIAATAVSIRHVADQASAALGRVAGVLDRVENGRGWAHVLLYEEPRALHDLDAVLRSTRTVLERVERGEGAAGVLTSGESTASARRFVAAMDELSRFADRASKGDGLLPALLFDPQYRPVLEDLRTVARNFRDVSDRLARGKGVAGALLRDDHGQTDLEPILQDLRVAVANLRAVSEKVSHGEGTLGALIEDPTVYDRLVTILEGTERSRLLRWLIRQMSEPAPRQGQHR